ncbi:uncharacterized [Tachysurus ichikawai]
MRSNWPGKTQKEHRILGSVTAVPDIVAAATETVQISSRIVSCSSNHFTPFSSVALCQPSRNRAESECNSVRASLPRRIAVTYCRSRLLLTDLLANAECRVERNGDRSYDEF